MKVIPRNFSLSQNLNSIRVVNKPMTVKVKFAKNNGKIKTLEGYVNYQAGAAIVYGESGEVWPLERDKFESIYVATNGTIYGKDGLYQKYPVEVIAIQLAEPTGVKVGYAEDTIIGQPGDWLLQYAENNFGIVNAEIFKNTYAIIS